MKSRVYEKKLILELTAKEQMSVLELAQKLHILNLSFEEKQVLGQLIAKLKKQHVPKNEQAS